MVGKEVDCYKKERKKEKSTVSTGSVCHNGAAVSSSSFQTACVGVREHADVHPDQDDQPAGGRETQRDRTAAGC